MQILIQTQIQKVILIFVQVVCSTNYWNRLPEKLLWADDNTNTDANTNTNANTKNNTNICTSGV